MKRDEVEIEKFQIFNEQRKLVKCRIKLQSHFRIVINQMFVNKLETCSKKITVIEKVKFVETEERIEFLSLAPSEHKMMARDMS